MKMKETNRIQDSTTIDQGRAVSANSLIIDNYHNKGLIDERSTTTTTTNKPKDNWQKSLFSSQQNDAEPPKLRGTFGLTRAATIIWYICIVFLFLIAFITLVLSILYFATDTTKEQIIKLYGICGGGSLAIVICVIVFLDCCNDGNRKDLEAISEYTMLQAQEAKRKAFARRRGQQTFEEKAKATVVKNQQPQTVSNEADLHSHHHHHHQPYPRVIHHPHLAPPGLHNHPLIYPVSARPNLIDIGVETTDRFIPISKYRNNENGTQTDRTEGTQTSTRDLNGIPRNVTEIIHERTIMKAPRELLNTIKQSMAQQDRDLAANSDLIDANTLIAFV